MTLLKICMIIEVVIILGLMFLYIVFTDKHDNIEMEHSNMEDDLNEIKDYLALIYSVLKKEEPDMEEDVHLSAAEVDFLKSLSDVMNFDGKLPTKGGHDD